MTSGVAGKQECRTQNENDYEDHQGILQVILTGFLGLTDLADAACTPSYGPPVLSGHSSDFSEWWC